jgi:hypothetical protein
VKQIIGTITIDITVDAHEDEDGDVTIDGGSTPALAVEVDLPGENPIGLAVKFLRRVADDLETASK